MHLRFTRFCLLFFSLLSFIQHLPLFTFVHMHATLIYLICAVSFTTASYHGAGPNRQHHHLVARASTTTRTTTTTARTTSRSTTSSKASTVTNASSTSKTTTTTSASTSCAPRYTLGSTTITGTGSLPKPTSYVKRNGANGLSLDGKPYRIVGPNIFWLGLENLCLIYTSVFVLSYRQDITGQPLYPDKGVKIHRSSIHWVTIDTES